MRKWAQIERQTATNYKGRNMINYVLSLTTRNSVSTCGFSHHKSENIMSMEALKAFTVLKYWRRVLREKMKEEKLWVEFRLVLWGGTFCKPVNFV